MRFLALDLATRLGFAVGSVSEGVIASGSYRLPSTGDDVGAFLAAYCEWLHDRIGRHGIGEVIFEMPILPAAGKTSLITLRKLYSLAGLTEFVALQRKIRCTEANISDVRTHALGKGNVPRRSKVAKPEIMAWCERQGWHPADDDEGDALALLSYRLAHFDPEGAIRATPLFGSIAA